MDPADNSDWEQQNISKPCGVRQEETRKTIVKRGITRDQNGMENIVISESFLA